MTPLGEMTPDLLSLLAGAAFGAFAIGFGIGWLGKPKAPPAPPKPVFGDDPEEPPPVDPGSQSGAVRRLGAAAAADRPRILATPGGTDFDTWKDRRLSDELRDENTELRNLFTLLPGITRRITETLKRGEIAAILSDMVTRLCIPPPDKVLVCLASREHRDLVLVAKLGVHSDDVFEGMRLSQEQGLIGECVRRQVVVERTVRPGAPPEPRAPGELPVDLEIAAPMLHNRQLHGVIGVAGVPPTSRFAKRMVTVCANLGALALANADFVGQIQRMADSDALTGLYNKRYFFEHFERALEQSSERKEPLSLFMFDIDHFKKYNDRNGHQAGDEALRLTGKILREHTHDGHLAARYGGEEFVVVMPRTARTDARAFAEQVRAAVNQSRYAHGDTQPLGMVSISGGVASFPEDGKSSSALIEKADARLYDAKNKGRNQVSA